RNDGCQIDQLPAVAYAIAAVQSPVVRVGVSRAGSAATCRFAVVTVAVRPRVVAAHRDATRRATLQRDEQAVVGLGAVGLILTEKRNRRSPHVRIIESQSSANVSIG